MQRNLDLEDTYILKVAILTKVYAVNKVSALTNVPTYNSALQNLYQHEVKTCNFPVKKVGEEVRSWGVHICDRIISSVGLETLENNIAEYVTFHLSIDTNM